MKHLSYFLLFSLIFCVSCGPTKKQEKAFKEAYLSIESFSNRIHNVDNITFSSDDLTNAKIQADSIHKIYENFCYFRDNQFDGLVSQMNKKQKTAMIEYETTMDSIFTQDVIIANKYYQELLSAEIKYNSTVINAW